MVRVWPGVAAMLARVVNVVIVVGQFGRGCGGAVVVVVVVEVEVRIKRDIVP